ncbi:MAG: hypothetical protein J7K85_01595 [Anaerolineaceae bacterium]|nr:hypothetical protein [Anaerolineaceae bacterium]
MNNYQKFTTIFATMLILVFAFPGTVQAEDGDQPGQIVLGGNYVLDEDETLYGDLVIIGGNASLKAGSILHGNILIAGGTINASGTINGNILSFGGVVNIKSNAEIRGDLVRFGGVYNVDKGAEIEGNMVSNEGITVDFLEDWSDWKEFDYENQIEEYNPIQQAFSTQRIALEKIGEFLLNATKALGLAVLTVIASLFLLKPMERSSETLYQHPALSFGIGLLTLIAFPILMVLLLFTIILIPVSILGLIGLALVILFGWFTLSLLLGRRLAEVFKTRWTDPLNAGVGSLALSLVAAIASIIPCIGWLLPALFISAGLGAAVMSRFGTRVYIKQTKPATAAQSQKPQAGGEYELPVTSEALQFAKEESLPQSLLNDLKMDDELPPLDLDNYETDKDGEDK